jgi:nitrate reductase NapE component
LESRVALLVIAIALAMTTHSTLGSELSNWDGAWYLAIVRHGYPSYVPHGQSTLGFFPVYPLFIVAVSWLLHLNALVAALLVSSVSGLVGLLLAERLVEEWWGYPVSRKAFLLMCFFPGSVVFSMVYPEGLTITLIAGCLLALSRKRWLVAGALAGVAGAVEPIGLVAILVCTVAAWQQASESRWDLKTIRQVGIAPLLSLSGIGAFGIFLWIRTGSPLATVQAQANGWHQNGNPVELMVHVISAMASGPSAYLATHHVNLDFISGLLGAVFLILSVLILSRHGSTVSFLPDGTGISLEGYAWVVGIGLMTLWSIRTPPNPRMLMLAFPSVAIWAEHLKTKGLLVFVTVETVAFLVMSAMTFHGRLLTP